MAPPTTFGVVAEREIYVAKEATPGVIPASVGVPVPVTSFKPSNKPMWLDDDSMQGSMGDVFGVYQGPLIAGFDIGGHLTGDTFPHFIYNLLGDYTVTGTTAAPTATTSAGIAAGVTAIPVASGGASFTTGMFAQLVDTGTPAASEIVQVGAGSTATSIVLAAGVTTRFAHLTGMVVNNTTFPYTHVFSLLNGSVGAANGPAQGPTHCITDRQGIAANGAEQYAYSVMSDITITGNAEKLLDWSGKAVCMTRQPAGSAVGMVNVSTVNPYPSWRSITGVGGLASGGTLRKEIAEWSVTLGRAVKAYNTDQGAQTPFIIARGKQSNTGKHTVSPAIDDSSLIALLANTQPQLQYVVNNGLSGANLVQVQVDIVLAAYETADIEDGSELFGFSVPYKAVHTAATGAGSVTTTGASGGKGAVKVTIQNAVPTY
jgi:hypothetical protein